MTSKPKVLYSGSVPQLFSDLDLAGRAIEQIYAERKAEAQVLVDKRYVKSQELIGAKRLVATAIQFGAETSVYDADVSRIRAEIEELDRSIKAKLGN